MKIRSFHIALLLLAIPTLHAAAQFAAIRAADYGLRGRVSSVLEREIEYHGLLDAFSPRRGRVLWEYYRTFDSLGRLVRLEERDGAGVVGMLTTYAWHGNVAEVRFRDLDSPGRSWRSVLMIDDSGVVRQSMNLPDSGGALNTTWWDPLGQAYRYYDLRDSATFDSTRRVWRPGLVESDQYFMDADGQSADGAGWTYTWACMFYDTSAALWYGDRRDARGRLLEHFEHPVFGCWASSSKREEYLYNDHDDVTTINGEYWGEPGMRAFDYRYDDRGNWVEKTKSLPEDILFVRIIIPYQRTLRTIEYMGPTR